MLGSGLGGYGDPPFLCGFIKLGVDCRSGRIAMRPYRWAFGDSVCGGLPRSAIHLVRWLILQQVLGCYLSAAACSFSHFSQHAIPAIPLPRWRRIELVVGVVRRRVARRRCVHRWRCSIPVIRSGNIARYPNRHAPESDTSTSPQRAHPPPSRRALPD